MWAANLIPGVLRGLWTPAGKLLLAGLALFVWTAYHRADATADCKEDQLRAELAAANAALQKAADISRDAANRAAIALEELAQLRSDKDALLAELDAAGQSCALPDDLRDRLLRIR